jgi:hypothetical protein
MNKSLLIGFAILAAWMVLLGFTAFGLLRSGHPERFVIQFAVQVVCTVFLVRHLVWMRWRA